MGAVDTPLVLYVQKTGSYAATLKLVPAEILFLIANP
jgi:hypothetical protein